eukprot:TRINITY_DN6333_c0_g1_i1.p1 TRINITY_DN6333_c0_g1~~TRINITY_DN6333_c0_g1_i1.p1  ORF type:complete len:326 (+),score=61.58 TRINITY_DN6333_c0_g1_i1:46-1023(+)
MLMQDKLNNPYLEDKYQNPYGASRSTQKKKNEDDLDDDYVPDKIKRQARQISAKKRGPQKRKREKEENEPSPKKLKTEGLVSSELQQNLTNNSNTTVTQDKLTPIKMRTQEKDNSAQITFNKGKWTDEEEDNFLQSLELYGRDWDKVQGHIMTRDKDSIRSHAQKHFIKLFRENKAVPAKVAETGAGHTLSGKPLDPGSAAARKYLTGKYAHMIPNNSEPSPKKAKSTTKSPTKNAKKKKVPFRESDLGVKVSTVLFGDKKQVYNKDRLRKASVNWKSIGDNRDPHTMISCDYFEPGQQPFAVRCHSNVLFLADLHSHLASWAMG